MMSHQIADRENTTDLVPTDHLLYYSELFLSQIRMSHDSVIVKYFIERFNNYDSNPET